jgi:hypothetical protein
VPRYFFHVYDGRADRDTTGTELPGVDQARREAIAYAGRILDDDAHRIALGEDWHMDVTDEAGLLLFRLDFLVTNAPAVPVRRKP